MKVINEIIDITPESEFNSDSVLFFDIETTGLKKENAQVYLIGCAFKTEEGWNLRQYLTENALDEGDVVEAFYEFAKNYKTLVHFNGNRFDVPFMDYKAELYDIDFRLAYMKNFDIYLEAKVLRGLLQMDGMGQKAIESFLCIGRDDEMGGGELIAYYYEYERTKDKTLEKFLLLHNHDDVKGMIPLMKILDYLQILNRGYTFESIEEIDGTAVMNFRLNKPVTAPFENSKWNMILDADGDLLQINVKIYEGEAAYPLEDYKNYYYLTEEHQVIHKDVAAFVDKSRKRRATKEECCVKKNGKFLPFGEGIFEPVFYVSTDKKCAYFEFTEDVKNSSEKLTAYADQLIIYIFAKNKKNCCK